MPPKTGLLGTLSSLALGVGLAASGPAIAQDQQRFVELCSWIDQENDPAKLQEIINKLNNNAVECYFDPATGQNYCNACLSLAAAKLVQITNTGGPPPVALN
jgi:hypothetical protein